MNLWSVEHFLNIFVITFAWDSCCFAVAPTQKWWKKWPRNVQLIRGSFGKEILLIKFILFKFSIQYLHFHDFKPLRYFTLVKCFEISYLFSSSFFCFSCSSGDFWVTCAWILKSLVRSSTSFLTISAKNMMWSWNDSYCLMFVIHFSIPFSDKGTKFFSQAPAPAPVHTLWALFKKETFFHYYL